MISSNKPQNIIAICCATLRELSVLEPIDMICQTANEHGMGVQIFQSFEELDVETEVNRGEEKVFDLINYDILCGMVIFGEKIKNKQIIQRMIDEAAKRDIPVVSFDQKNEGCHNVTFDYADAFEQLVRHLVEYHKFQTYFVMAGVKNNSFSDERLDVIRRVFAENNLSLKEEDIAYGDFWEIPTKNAMEEFFETHKELPEAFIALNDTMAMVVIDEIQKRGYKVPDDVVVTGFDGIYLAENFVPKITTAKQQFDKAGNWAVKIIMDYQAGELTDLLDVSIPFTTQIRQSCGCHGVDTSGVTGNIRGLYTEFENCKRFGTYMDQMARRMVANGTVMGFKEDAIASAYFVDNHDNLFICLKKDLLRVDRDFLEAFEKENPKAYADKEKNMVLVAHKGENFAEEFADFSEKELLPSCEKIQKSIPNLLVVTIHDGADIYGYMVANYKIGSRDTYKTKMYTNRLSNAVLLIVQRNLIANSNHELLLAKNKLEEMYNLDPMTGIYNRRGFFQNCSGFLEKKKEGYVTVLSVDLDWLKPINDTYGHQEGDFTIKTLSVCLKEMVGDDGLLARFGGDEFVAMIYQDTITEDMTTSLWENMAARLDIKKKEAEKPYDISCSLGAVTQEWKPDLDVETMISASDKILYAMKRKHHANI